MIKKLSFLNGRRGLALLFTAMLLLGFCTASDYGVHFDQLTDQSILREYMKEYAAIFEGEDSDAYRYYDALGVRRISESYEKNYGISAYYPIVPLMTWLYDQGETAALSALWHAYTWFLYMLGVTALYLLLREMGMGRFLSLAGMMLLFLSPRFFAEGHYNNKDIVLLSLSLCVFYTGLRLLKKPTALRGFLFSLFGAVTANARIAGICVWGMLSLCAVALVSARRMWNRKTIGTAVVTLLSFALVYTLVSPAMWRDPVEYFDYLLVKATHFDRWGGAVYFRSMLFNHMIGLPLPRYYLPYMIATTLPLFFYPFCIVGQVAALCQVFRQRTSLLRDPKALVLLCATLLWTMIVGYVMLNKPLIYNGWRHFYFLFAGLVILAAYGMQCLWNAVQKRGAIWRRISAALCCALLAGSAVGIALNHPYQYGYYNLLIRHGADETMELDYWMVSTVNALRKLLVCERDHTLPLEFSTKDYPSFLWLDSSWSGLTKEEREPFAMTDEENSPYRFVNKTYAHLYGIELPLKGYHELFRLESYGNTLCIVYERDPD